MTSFAHLPELEPVGWLGVIATLCLVLGYAFKAVRSLVRITRRAGEFFDDWQGEDARPGFAARPGIPERISRLEAQSAIAEKQLQTNGGMSLRDQTDRIEKALNEHITATSGGHG